MYLGSVLEVQVSLEFKLLSSPKDSTRARRPIEKKSDWISKPLLFTVPEKPCVQSATLDFGFESCALNLKVTWSDDYFIELVRLHAHFARMDSRHSKSSISAPMDSQRSESIPAPDSERQLLPSTT